LLISHFDPSGQHEVAVGAAGHELPKLLSRTPFFHRFARHRLCLGLMIAFWAAPTMSAGHLLFAGVTTAYICMGTILHDRDLVGIFGDKCRHHREHLSMQCPSYSGLN